LGPLAAGTYSVIVKDTSKTSGFRLSGPGVNKATSVKGTGTVTWKLVFQKGKYTFTSVPAGAAKKGSFNVTN